MGDESARLKKAYADRARAEEQVDELTMRVLRLTQKVEHYHQMAKSAMALLDLNRNPWEQP